VLEELWSNFELMAICDTLCNICDRCVRNVGKCSR
jgi:hypothetical protein